MRALQDTSFSARSKKSLRYKLNYIKYARITIIINIIIIIIIIIITVHCVCARTCAYPNFQSMWKDI